MIHRYRKTLGVLSVSILFFFVGRVVHKEWDKISGYNWSPDLAWMISSVMVLLAAYLFSAFEWTLILKMIGARIGWVKGVSIFLLSIFGRYIPGGVWSTLGRIYLCRLEGIPDSRSSMSVLLEQSYPVVSAGIVSAASLLFWEDTALKMKVLPFIFLLPLFVIFLHPKPFLKVANPILSWFGKGPVTISLPFSNMLVLVICYIFSWVISGTAFYLFVHAFYPLELRYLPILSGIYAISFTAGYLTIFIPAGLGVREGSLTILLSFFMPTPIAMGVALLSRIWLIGTELIIFLMLFFLNAETRRMVKTAVGW